MRRGGPIPDHSLAAGGREVVRNLADWLEENGLRHHLPVFAANDIDLDVLTQLSDADLQSIGLSLGDRRRLQRGLATLRVDSPLHPAGRSASASPAGLHESHEAERRQVTVMFCDLVGSTELANRLDPEDMGLLIGRFQRACANAISRFDGFVAKFMGDGVLAYFGYPQANEDAAEQSILAAIAIVDGIRRITRPDGRPLEVRIGIATGTVLIGDIVGEGPAREHSIVGETPNLAARLQSIAAPDAIVISDGTRRLLGQRFECQSLGAHALKGFAALVNAWGVQRENVAETRFAATREKTDRTFVGRGEEIAALRERWRLAAKGRGQALLISGEAGIGKSRLVSALLEHIDGRDWRRLTCQCSPYHTNSALHPVIRHFERAANFSTQDTAATKLDKLEAMLAETDENQATISLVADLLSLPTDRYPAPPVPPAQRKGATIRALVDIIRRLSRKAPVVLLLEDAHWSDPTTRELWTQLIETIANDSVLALMTARPEFISPWSLDRVQILELSHLTGSASAELVAGVSGSQQLSAALVDDIVAKADGVPLFVEELTKSVLESIGRPSVPATLQDSLMARLDRLGAAKELAQVAAVIGQQFSETLLAAVSQESPAALIGRLDQLVASGITFRVPRSTEPTYSFRHALLRDVAYENLLRTRRLHIHAKVARALVDHFPAICETEPELPAYHFAHAGMSELACAYHERAGDRAVARSSYVEAIAQFNAALGEAAKLGAGPERIQHELRILLKSGPPLAIIQGGHSAEVADLYQRAHERASTMGGDSDLFKATWGLWYNTVTSRRLDRARSHAEALVTLAARAGDDDLMLEGFHCRWSTAWFRGELQNCIANAREGVSRYDPKKHSWMGPIFGGHDPGVCAHGVLCQTYALTGEHAEAERCVERALLLAGELGQPNNVVHALMNCMVCAQIRHDYQAATRHSDQMLMLCDKYHLPPPKAHAVFLSGWVKAWTGDLIGGMAIMEAEYPRASTIGPFFRYYAALLAETRERAGRSSDALALLQSTIATIVEPGVGMYVSELYRLEGICLLEVDPWNAERAIASLRTAMTIAKQQGATLLELNAALSLAHAARTLGEAADALAVLGTLCAALPADVHVPALVQARQMLAEADARAPIGPGPGVDAS